MLKRQNNHIKIKTKKRKIINGKRILAILIFLTILYGICSNIFNNKTEAATKDVYDVILFFGQSNMVGCASGNSETRQGTTQSSKEQFSTKTGIEYDIVNNIVDRGSVKVPIQNGIAYEYLYNPTTDDGWYGSTRSYTTNGITYTWTNENKNLRPIGWGEGFEGRYQTGENLTCSASTGSITKVTQSAHRAGTDVNSELSYVTNMVPEFCRRYYENTGRKVVAVVCAQGGKSIQYFAPGYSENGTSMHELMKRKLAAAVGYVQSKDDMQLGKCMFVSMQGENNCGNMTTEQYITYYRQVVDSLKSYCGITNGALIETGHEIPTPNSLTGGVSMATLNTIHTAQEYLINNYSDTVLGTDFPYQSFIPNTQQDYEQNCLTEVSFVPGYYNRDNPNPDYRYGYTDAIAQAALRVDYNTNSIHFTAASLCQVGRETADSLAKTIADGQVTLSSESGSTPIGSQATVSVKYNKSGGNLWVASADPTIASIDTSVLADSSQASQVNTNTSLLLNGTTIKINANKVGSTVIWVRSDANGAYKQASAKYIITVTKKSLNPPALTNTSFTYNGSAQSPTYTGFDINTMNVSGNSATNVGNYTITFSLKDSNNYQWGDGTTTNKTASWSIGKKSITAPTVTNTSKTYNGSAQSPTYTGFDNSTMNVSGNSATNVGNYTITFSLKDSNNYQWGDGTITNKSTSWSIGKSSVTPPKVTNTSLTYNGLPQSPSYSGFDNSTMNESGNRETDAGDYTITFSLRDKTNSQWSDGTTTDKSTPWSIAKITPTITLSPASGEVNVGSTTTFTASVTSGAGALNVTSLNESKATATISNGTVTVTGVSTGSATITVSSEPTTNYNATSANYTATIKASDLTVPTLTNKSFTYDGSVKEPTVNGFDANKMNQGGKASATDVGTYVVTWSLRDPTNNKWKDGTTEQKTAAWSISPKNISSAVITLSPTSFEYDGTEKTPTITVKDGSKTLTSGTDYTVSYSNNKNVGTATLTITGQGNYTGTKSANYTITSRNIGNTTITLSQSNYTYDGSAKEPTVTIKDGPVTLTNGTDYTVSYSNNVNPGTAMVTISGKGIFSGTKTVNFTIAGRDIGSATLALSPTSFEYDGTAKTPTITVKDGSKTLTSGTDYTVSYSNNVNVGTAIVTISGKGNYSGTKSGNFTITAKDINSTTLTIGETSYVYDGSAKEPSITIKDGSKTLTSGTDYTVSYSNNTNPGTATVTISGKGNYSGTKSGNFAITQRDISTATVSLSESSFGYDGNEKEPSVTVKIGNSTLTSNDYTVSYSNNTDAGTATVTISGKGNCTGSKTANFTISKRVLNVRAQNKTIEYGTTIPELTIEYSGNVNGQTPKITGKVKTEATATSAIGTYDILNDNLALADNGTFKAENYSLSYTKGTLTITGKDLSNYPVTVSPASYIYDGTAKEPAVTIKDGNTTLTSGTDYTVNYSNNTNAGTATVTITGKGNYKGTNTKGTFTIKNKETNFIVTLEETSYEYDGTAKEPEVTVKDGNTELTKNTDYTVNYSKNTNVGTADVVITGKGNYGGSKLEHFTITKKDFVITAENKTRKYGEENPELTYKYSGNVEGEVPSFSGSLATSASKTSNVGEYDITNGTIAVVDTNTFKGSNYNLTYAKGKLTIGKAEGKINLTDGENEEPEEGEVVLNCKRVIGINATGAVSVTSSKENIATAELKNNKIEITGIAIGEATITVTSAETNNYEAATRTYRVEVIPVALEKIEMKVLPKTSYIEEQELEVTGGKLKLLFNNGVESEADITEEMVTGYDKTKIGEQTLTVTYQGKETEYTVVVREKAPTKIQIEKMPDKTKYMQKYEQLDVTGGKIKVTYDNGTTGILDMTEEMVTGFDNTKLGINTIKVTYQGKESTFNVQIVEKQVTKIEIIELPQVLTYVQDYGILDVTGGKIKVTFDDQTEVIMDMTKEMVTGFNNKNVGEQELTLTIGGKTVPYEVEVIDKVITNIEIVELPDKTEYTLKYDELDLIGGKLKVTYNNKYTDVINIVEEMVSGFDNTKLGKDQIKVTYGGFEQSFNVTIEEHKPVRVEVVEEPDKVEYGQGEELVLTGGKVKIYYNDETSEVVDMKEEMLEKAPTFETSGKKLVTLIINGQEVSFEVAAKDENQSNNNNNNNSKNNNGNNQVDNTTAKTEIPQTGVQTGTIILGVTILLAIGGVATIRIFKNKDIK